MNRDEMSHDVLHEIMSQPKIWERTLAMLQQSAASSLSNSSGAAENGPIVLTGCGSSYYLSAAVSPLWGSKSDAPVRAISATDLLTYPEGYLNRSVPGTLIAVSRWGKTPETCTAARHARQDLGWKTIALTCDPKSPLTEICNETISLAEAAENARFTTQALTAMILTLEELYAQRYHDVNLHGELLKLPGLASRLMERYGQRVKEWAAQGNWQDYVYLGQGPYFGVASELMLKMKEIACAPAEVYSSLEYLHGPRYSAGPSTLIVVLLSDGGYQYQVELLGKLRTLESKILTVCEKQTEEIAANSDYIIELNSGLSDYGRLVLTMPLLQLFAYYRALTIGKAAWIEKMVYTPSQAHR
jgi:glucosamine--fructose-6-phosphate aminotransferase (isomerizing)